MGARRAGAGSESHSPIAYESTGEVTQFTVGLDPHPASREVSPLHRPAEFLRHQSLGTEQIRRKFPEMPDLPQGSPSDATHETVLVEAARLMVIIVERKAAIERSWESEPSTAP